MFVCAECGASLPEPGYCGVDGSALHPRGDDPLLGTTIGPYRVARLMGIGGMGRVYRAVHPTIGSRVAIKILSRESSDRPDLVERFFAEAKAVNLIRHESIVNVLDLATLPDGRPFIVMEHLEGSSLAAIADDARRSGRLLPLGGVARLIVEVLEGLGAAHAKGIVHRDLKPDNIFITPQGRAKILDFGIAKLQPDLGATSPSNPTQTGSLLGTPHYMSPEQAAGRGVDSRADLYAMGVILFELSTGQRPFSPPALFDLLRMHIEAPPPSARSLRAAIPASLEQVIYIALAKTPEQRFGTAQAMSAALQNATAQLPGDQWEPIVGGRKSRPNMPPVAWAPTPPASWAGSAATDRASRAAPDTERQATPPTVDRVVEHPSTQTAGQVVTPGVSGSSKKTALLVLGGLALAGGGIAVGVVASGGKSTSVTATGSGSSVAVADIHSADAATQDLAVPDGIDDLGAFAAAADALAGVNTGDGSEPPPKRGSTSDARDASGWIKPNFPLAYNGYYDPKGVDVNMLVNWTRAEAQKLYSDAKLTMVIAYNMNGSAQSDVTAPDKFVSFRFVVPSRPAGKCAFLILVDNDGADILPDVTAKGSCAKEPFVGKPKCSVLDVLGRARQQGIEGSDLVDLMLLPAAGGMWTIHRVGESAATAKTISDDCGAAN